MQLIPLSSHLRIVILLLALVPVMIFAYLGQFSRLMSDDYCTTYIGNEQGIISGMQYWYNTWAGAYTNFLIKSALAQLDVSSASLLPILIICCWLAGAFYLTYQLLNLIKLNHYMVFGSALFSLSFVYVTMNGLYSPQSFYWLAASIPNTIGIGLLMMLVAFCIQVHQADTQTPIKVMSIAMVLVLSFVVAGFSYVYVSVQAYVFAILILAIGLFHRALLKRLITVLFASGLLGSILSLIVQLTSPGIDVRLATESESLTRISLPLTDIISRAFEAFTIILSSPTVLSGFVILFLLALIATLSTSQVSDQSRKIHRPLIITWSQLMWFCIHLMFLPLLWNHSSDATTILNRFSVSYFMVIIANLLFLAVSFLAFYIKPFNKLVTSTHWKILVPLFLIGIFVVKQIFSIDNLASSYLTLSWGGLLFALLLLHSHDHLKIDIAYLIGSTVAVIGLSLAIVGAVTYSLSFVPLRTLTFASATFVLLGVIWGIAFGRVVIANTININLNRYVVLACLAIMLLTFQIVIQQSSQISQFSSYAQSWDARHADILAQARAGADIVTVNQLGFDLADEIKIVNLSQDPANRCAKQYYDIDDLVVD